MKNSVETLPKMIEYQDGVYFLHIHVTAWGNLCLLYKGLSKDEKYNTILSVVVEGPNKEPYFRQLDNLDKIADAIDLNDAVEITQARIDKFFKTVVIEKVIEK